MVAIEDTASISTEYTVQVHSVAISLRVQKLLELQMAR
jgi:hypothetical protein